MLKKIADEIGAFSDCNSDYAKITTAIFIKNSALECA